MMFAADAPNYYTLVGVAVSAVGVILSLVRTIDSRQKDAERLAKKRRKRDRVKRREEMRAILEEVGPTIVRPIVESVLGDHMRDEQLLSVAHLDEVKALRREFNDHAVDDREFQVVVRRAFGERVALLPTDVPGDAA